MLIFKYLSIILSLNSNFLKYLNFYKKKNFSKKIINFGPQHPAAHGVLRLVLLLRGEFIENCDIHIGFLHRNTENLLTVNTVEKCIPYFDRLDYVSMLSQEHAYCLSVENLLNRTSNNWEINSIRILFDEITRILNHLLAISCHALDIGNMSCLFWCFEIREMLMELYESSSGARMHANYHRPYFFFQYSFSSTFFYKILNIIKNIYWIFNNMHTALTYNKIWKQRLINIGTINIDLCNKYNITGVLSRSCGIKKDLRLMKFYKYGNYGDYTFNGFYGINGDSYDRYLIRMSEIGQSLSLIIQIVKKIKLNYIPNFDFSPEPFFDYLFYYSEFGDINFSNNTNKHYLNYSSMESTINNFVRWHSGVFLNSGIGTISIESPKGEYGVTVFGRNTTLSKLTRIRSPSYSHLLFLTKSILGTSLSDLSTLIGTVDIVFGEIDK